jgi:hypothetical protein
LELKPRKLQTHEKIKLKKEWESAGNNPGDYKAVLVVDYGAEKPVTRETFVKLGSLAIRIVDYTKKVAIGKLSKFEINLVSNWNNGVEDLYADIEISNSSSELTNFRTVPVTLEPWEEKTIEGYFDSSEFEKGVYQGNITLHYMKNSTSNLVEIEIVSSKIYLIIIGIAVVLGIIVLIIYWFVKNNKNGKKKNKKSKSKKRK